MTASDAAGHVGAAAHWRLDLAVTVRANRNGHRSAVVFDENVIHEGGVAGTAGGVDGHFAAGAGVKSHAENLADGAGSV
ncbi:hypothetical protein OAV85_00495 [Candidatus Nanopelagicales bacterium]|nr:hypothetical protein [Candidatus Nanopelagicales bacterium]